MYQHDNRLTYAELKRRAIDGIENGDVLQRADGTHRSVALHLFIKGRYYLDFNCWTIYRHSSSEKSEEITYSVIKANWKYKADMKRAEETSPSAFKPEPTWIIKQAPLQKAAREKRLQKGATIAIPVVGIHGHSGRDGADCGLRWHDRSTGISLYFWSRGPEEWKPLVDWMHKLINYLDAELRKAAHQRKQNTV